MLRRGSLRTNGLPSRNAEGAKVGGRGEIRTHGTLAGTPVFKTGALNHSATLPSAHVNGGERPLLQARCAGFINAARSREDPSGTNRLPPSRSRLRSSRFARYCCADASGDLRADDGADEGRPAYPVRTACCARLCGPCARQLLRQLKYRSEVRRVVEPARDRARPAGAEGRRRP